MIELFYREVDVIDVNACARSVLCLGMMAAGFAFAAPAQAVSYYGYNELLEKPVGMQGLAAASDRTLVAQKWDRSRIEDTVRKARDKYGDGSKRSSSKGKSAKALKSKSGKPKSLKSKTAKSKSLKSVAGTSKAAKAKTASSKSLRSKLKSFDCDTIGVGSARANSRLRELCGSR